MSNSIKQPHFFGYGSLVNRNTHRFEPTHPSRITGWRRVWHRAPVRPAAFLSVVPDPDGTIDGVIAPVPDHDWAALDAREYAYDRILVTDHVHHDAHAVRDISIYAIPSGTAAAPDEAHPILLSYVDAVIQGYLHHYGETGAAQFMQTTEGWDTCVLNDRAAPIYPRAQRLSVEEERFVDDMLSTIRAKVLV
ncbi:gamma-glutamylcyclotransferase family protein [Marivita sp. S0852]|uniref:gamma-glutamylcyclotransferase family protein n=1 Tax=Marivita sp. S0852 TaxID=3373893 RepID=UPI003982AFA8